MFESVSLTGCPLASSSYSPCSPAGSPGGWGWDRPLQSLLTHPRRAFSHPLATYIKVYLLENGACLAKKKTKVAKKTCDPLYQQALLFDEGPQGKVLQVSVRGQRSRLHVIL